MDPALPDVQLSRYRLERPLGSGGMGAVYLAHDLSLDRPVAIKFISNERAADPVARRRLVREARAAAALDHPHICTIYEVIDEAGSPACIVMQYVEGETLAARLRGGRLDVRSAVGIAGDIASALAHAHKRNIIHRDLKPQNIIITREGRARLLDFGIAQHTDPGEPSDDVTTASRLTEPGATPGTPAYMSPEQVQGRTLDGRSDLFALGAVLFECLTGERAFKGRNAMEIAGQIVAHDPPLVSSLRPELREAHDEICRRLLARDPRDRFNSADELLGALQLLSTSTSLQRTGGAQTRPSARMWMKVAAVFAALVLVAGLAWRWRTPPPAFPKDPQAAEWYRRGTEAIREGLPHSARLALNEAVKAAPEYAPAYIRLAEAEIELDDANAARQALLRVDDLVENESRLPFEDRTRVNAVRALMLRDLDAAVEAYRELAERRPEDPGAWLDVGRALDASGLRSDARASYERALQINDDYAPAHLGRGTILGLEGRRDEAMAEFDAAERLYRAAANVEGEVETLIRRGFMLNGGGELQGARAALVRARDLARNLESRAQQIRAELTLSSVIASEGNWRDAEKMATNAIEAALRAELESVAAEGLVELATVLLYQGDGTEAEEHLQRAIELAEKRGAGRIVARATLQRAAIMLAGGRPADALATAQDPLEYLGANRYRRLELAALTIMARAHEELGQYVEARSLAERALQTATAIKDEAQVADALENLAGQDEALGALPSALEYRKRALDIHRRQNDLSRLGYDLVNTADLLIRLGEHREAARLLDEVQAGATNRLEAYVQRVPMSHALRMLSAGIQHQLDEVRNLGRLDPEAGSGSPFPIALASQLERYADGGSRVPARTAGTSGGTDLAGSVSSPGGRELRYWALAGRLGRGDARGAIAGVEATLADKAARVSYEFEWRIAAIGAAAAAQLKDEQRRGLHVDRARAALNRLRREWKSNVDSYEARQDLTMLRQIAGLN